MNLSALLNTVISDHGGIILLVLTLVEISPIKINPWGALFNYIGKRTTAETNMKLDNLAKEFTFRENELKKSHEVLANSFESLGNEIQTVKREFENKTASDKRWDILDFANSCRNGRKHGREEWMHVIAQLKEYETYVQEHDIDNGVIEEETKYLRELYRKRCEENDFIQKGKGEEP